MSCNCFILYRIPSCWKEWWENKISIKTSFFFFTKDKAKTLSMSDPRGVYVVSSNSGMDRSRRKPVVNVVDGTRNWSTVPCACCADCSSCKFRSFYINTVNESTEHLLSFYDPIATARTYHVGPSLKIIRKTNTNISPNKLLTVKDHMLILSSLSGDKIGLNNYPS